MHWVSLPLSFYRAEPQKINWAQTDWLSMRTHILIMLELLNVLQGPINVWNKTKWHVYYLHGESKKMSLILKKKKEIQKIFFPQNLASVPHYNIKKDLWKNMVLNFSMWTCKKMPQSFSLVRSEVCLTSNIPTMLYPPRLTVILTSLVPCLHDRPQQTALPPLTPPPSPVSIPALAPPPILLLLQRGSLLRAGDTEPSPPSFHCVLWQHHVSAATADDVRVPPRGGHRLLPLSVCVHLCPLHRLHGMLLWGKGGLSNRQQR